MRGRLLEEPLLDGSEGQGSIGEDELGNRKQPVLENFPAGPEWRRGCGGGIGPLLVHLFPPCASDLSVDCAGGDHRQRAGSEWGVQGRGTETEDFAGGGRVSSATGRRAARECSDQVLREYLTNRTAC